MRSMPLKFNYLKMKVLFPFYLIAGLFLSTITLASCTKKDGDSEEETATPQTPVSPSMSWNVNAGESAFVADTTSYSYSYDESLGLHLMSASDNGGRTITFMMASIAPGSYEVDFDSTVVLWQSGTNIYNGGFNPQGEIIITENSENKIKGTFEATVFSFTTATEIDLTSGTFNLLPVSN